MKKITIILTVLGAMLITSCEEFLDVEPSNLRIQRLRS